MTTTAAPTWQELFDDHRHLQLGCLAKATHPPRPVRSVADEEVRLVGMASEAARLSSRPKATPDVPARLVVVTPQSKEATAQQFAQLVEETRQLHPQAELEGFGPSSLPLPERFRDLDRAVVLVGRLDGSFHPSPDLPTSAELEQPVTAVLIYAPEVGPAALEQAVNALKEMPNLVGVVPLPAGAGDRIPLPGLTTGGSTDMMVISVLRYLLPAHVRVRSCWAALGWKVAQAALAYGADEIAGWTAAETLAYTGRVRAASRVERQELNEGLDEARRQNLGWPTTQGDAR